MRGVKALLTRLRRRVWSGGSVAIMLGGALSASACISGGASKPGWKSLEKSSASRSTAWTSA